MKHTFNNNILALLVLATAGMSAGAQANNSATVTITAEITEKLDLAVDKNTVDFTEGKMADEIVITTSNNHAAKITVTGDETATGDHFNLKQGDYTIPVTATITGDTEAKFDEKHVMTHNLDGNKNDLKTRLHLTATPADTQKSGAYDGTLTIKIEKQ
ncbi:hypothetical protein [Serratia ficaria]|uniref:hypothetical protein n=1 Tax=Serratia ficaria TaxID=61651 RepID=UPI00217C3106|nr:hypothetical protein [Serratia ficaria]CAI1507993.1 Uncharacterised protein [Serratia ficaria]